MKNDLLCFSHLRWRFVYQRPQHLMSRFARTARVFYIEEPVWGQEQDSLVIQTDPDAQVYIVTPQLFERGDPELVPVRLRKLIDRLIREQQINDFVSWYYSPMALTFSDHLRPRAVVYDCMDELSAFRGAPAALLSYEKLLMQKAGVVFTGGNRLYQAKKPLHSNIFAYPSAIDKEFFYPARGRHPDPEDQRAIPHLRLGFFGVLDERLDTDLLDKMATLKPKWHFILIGPVVKIDPADLPRHSNIHYLGMKDYKLLPAYICGWDLCIMPFAINASTAFISPTKTPEFLAAGKRVISTPIHDVEHPYGADGLVSIAATAEEFIEVAEHDLRLKDKSAWLGKVDHFLSGISWERTWEGMDEKIELLLQKKTLSNLEKQATCMTM